MKIIFNTLGRTILTIWFLGTTISYVFGWTGTDLVMDFSMHGIGMWTGLLFCTYFGIWCFRSTIENSKLWSWKQIKIFRPIDLSGWYKK